MSKSSKRLSMGTQAQWVCKNCSNSCKKNESLCAKCKAAADKPS